MTVNTSNRFRAPSGGRDPEFALAMARAEAAAQPPKPEQPEYVGRTRGGLVQRANGTLFQPGPLFDFTAFSDLPLLD